MSHAMAIAAQALDHVGLPAIIRPSFTLGGTGGGIAFNRSEFFEIVQAGLDASPTTEVLIEESVLGWKEYEMEVVRDKADNCIIICSIENIDPMGVHTGDSITVAPALTLTDKEYQIMRNASIAVLREIGVETGGSNVQFAVNPADGRLVVIEMNPRVSRSSALASKATGFPIAKIAAKLAIGYTLDELENDITGGATPASLRAVDRLRRHQDPALRLREIPRRRAGADHRDEVGRRGHGDRPHLPGIAAEGAARPGDRPDRPRRDRDPRHRPRRGMPADDRNAIRAALGTPTPDRLRMVAQAIRMGTSLEDVHAMCKIDPWFLEQIAGIVAMEARIREHGLPEDAENLRMLKGMGFSDARLASLVRRDAEGRRQAARSSSTCTRSSSASTPAPPNSPRRPPTCTRPTRRRSPALLADEAQVSDRKKVVILGGGPNRIGQGIEFDYCCCHAAFALRDAGFEAIMINCNPETVSTDYDTSDRLYFEPLTAEDVLEILRAEQAKGELVGVIVQFGGQTPLKLADALEKAGIPILGTSPDMIDLAEDRDRFQKLLMKLDLDAAEERHRLFGRAGAAGGRRARLPAGRAPVLCARRPRHADHPRRGHAAELPARHRARPRAGGHQAEIPERQDRPDQHAARQEPAAVRHLSERRHRGRCRLPLRRQERPSCRASWSISRRPASIRATAPARCRCIRCRTRSSTSWSARRRRSPRRSMSAA